MVMLQTADWMKTGIVNDANYPDLSMQKIKVFGTRESVPLPLSTPIAILGGISAAVIWWGWNELKGTEIRVFTKLDNEAWQEVEKGQKILAILPSGDYSQRKLSVRLVLASTMTEIDPARCPELDELVIIFYPVKRQWDAEYQVKLVWRDAT
jgi:hypothetical protein